METWTFYRDLSMNKAPKLMKHIYAPRNKQKKKTVKTDGWKKGIGYTTAKGLTTWGREELEEKQHMESSRKSVLTTKGVLRDGLEARPYKIMSLFRLAEADKRF